MKGMQSSRFMKEGKADGSRVEETEMGMERPLLILKARFESSPSFQKDSRQRFRDKALRSERA